MPELALRRLTNWLALTVMTLMLVNMLTLTVMYARMEVLPADVRAATMWLHLVRMSAEDDPIVALDATGRIICWSDGAEQLTGISRTDALGRGIDLLIHDPAALEAHRAGFVAAIAGRGEASNYHHGACRCARRGGGDAPTEIDTYTMPGLISVAHLREPSP